MSRQIAHEKLKTLLPAQFDSVIFSYGMPPEYVRKDVAQAQQIHDLIRYAEQQKDGLKKLLAVIDDVCGAPLKSAAGKEKESTPGGLVYFLADRKPQEDVLRNALKKWVGQENKPFICIFYGTDKQHDHFFKRFMEHFFKEPGLSELFSKVRYMGSDYSALPLPYLENLRNLDELPSKLDEDDRLRETREKMKIWQGKAHRPVLYFEMSGKDWKGSKQCNTVSAFIKYWQERESDLSGKYPPLIMLWFQYSPPPYWLKWFSPHYKSRAWLCDLANSEHTGFQETFHLPGVVLPELKGIECDDAKKWVDLPEFKKRFRPSETQISKLKLRIGELYSGHNQELPMGELGVKLEQLVDSLSAR